MRKLIQELRTIPYSSEGMTRREDYYRRYDAWRKLASEANRLRKKRDLRPDEEKKVREALIRVLDLGDLAKNIRGK